MNLLGLMFMQSGMGIPYICLDSLHLAQMLRLIISKYKQKKYLGK